MPKPHQEFGSVVAPEGSSPRGPNTPAPIESVPPGSRRRFSASDKLRIVRAAEAALASGKRGALQELLRVEGLHSSQLANWRTQLGAGGEAGLTPRRPGRRPKVDAKDRELLAARKEVEKLERKLRVANALIALQKNGRARRRPPGGREAAGAVNAAPRSRGEAASFLVQSSP
jgi:transposase